MKLAVFADIHSNYLVFKKAFEQTKDMNVDNYIFLGDHVTDGFDGGKVLDLIKSTGGHAVNGNREVSLVEHHNNKNKDWKMYRQWDSMRYGYECLSKENIEFIESLDIYKIVNINDKKVCMSHSTPYSVRGDVFSDSYEMFDKLIEDYDCDIYLFGHEHKNFVTFYKNKYFINPGAMGLPTWGLPYRYGIIEINDDNINFETMEVDYDFDELANYYRNSEYYDIATIWCELLLLTMQDGNDHPTHFIAMIIKEALEKNIDISKNIPDALFEEVFRKYMEVNKKENVSSN